jgi:3-polyprenyl-4-hydroxybenzoate decarboxylase
MQYKDLREFIYELEKHGELKRISTEVNAKLLKYAVEPSTKKVQRCYLKM